MVVGATRMQAGSFASDFATNLYWSHTPFWAVDNQQ